MLRIIALILFQAFFALADAGEPPAIEDDKAPTAQASPMPSTIQLQVPTGDFAATKELAEIYRVANLAFREAKGGGADRVCVETAAKILAHVRKYPDDESSFNGIMTAIQLASRSPEGAKTRDEALALMQAMQSVVRLKAPEVRSAATRALAEVYRTANVAFREAKGDDTGRVCVETSAKIIAHARRYPTDESTLVALLTAMNLASRSRSPEGAKTRDEAIDLMATNFARSPSIRDHLRLLASGISEKATDLVRDVFRNHPDLQTRALAAKRLIAGLDFRVRFVNGLNSNEDVRRKWEKQIGKDNLQKIIAASPEAMKEIEIYRHALRTELNGHLPSVEVGDSAPETISVNLDGKPVKLSELRGKVVVLEFWGVWCGPCRELIPHTRELVKSLEGKPFVFVGICTDEDRETLTGFLKKEPMPWTHWWDGKKAVTEQWEVAYFPTLYVIDHHGIIRFVTQGYDPKGGKLDEMIKDLVRSAEAAG